MIRKDTEKLTEVPMTEQRKTKSSLGGTGKP